ncbi:MAG TPA: sigma 54-interacting transcriptional regulator [Thermoanaerobaculia bacterium]|nr:sigma 54-interacting transcriptional regulator [Thermoanaerobaculia bacterium]
MIPSLLALTGPLQGQTFALPEELSLGRHPSNGLRLADPSVSRHHAVLRRSGEAWKVVDLESRRGTFVNGQPVRERELGHGDFLVIGETTFLVSLRPPREEIPEPAGLEDSGLAGETEIRLAVSDSVYLRRDRLPEALAALLEIATASPRGSAALGALLLERVAAAVPAERVALLPADEEGWEPLYRSPAGEKPFAVSRATVSRALREREALLIDRAGGDEAPGSVSSAGIRSLACVPLLGADGPLGVLYADRLSPGERLGAEHLQWLAAAAALAAGPLASALRTERLERENRRLQAAELGHGLVGESAGLRRVWDVIARVAPTVSTVLILGESGTGKELAARAIHRASRRAGEPFVAINCATLSETLLESELFGHERGAFTGAVERKTGKLEVADGGTLFLDEVGEMPLQLQARLLRVLQERTFERVGSTRPVQVDIRLVAATNRDLLKAIAAGTFRSDLYYRLNVVSITMPPLRERREDIPLLASHFAALHGRAVRGREVGISPEARALLVRYDWPGNVRELGNAIERAAVLGMDDTIRPEDLPETLLETAPAADLPTTRFHDSLNDLKRRLIVEAVRESGGVITKAAERLGLHPNHLHRLITTLGLREEIEE